MVVFFNVFFLFYIDRRLFPDPRDSHPSCWILQTHVICGITGILTLNWHQINQISARTNWTTIFSKQKSIMTTFSSRLYHYKRVTFLLMSVIDFIYILESFYRFQRIIILLKRIQNSWNINSINIYNNKFHNINYRK